jgi:hypothetical protein
MPWSEEEEGPEPICNTSYVSELLPGKQPIAVLVGVIDVVGGIMAHTIQLHADQANGELAMVHSAVPSVPRGLTCGTFVGGLL